MKLLIFAGTSEGRLLCEFLSKNGIVADVCVATEYGQMIMPNLLGITVHTGRLQREEMEKLIAEFDTVIDATHPYASVVTETIKKACLNTRKEYLRLVRPSKKVDFAICVSSSEEAAEYLNSVDGNALLTTGSKELDKFTVVNNYKERLFPRVLPSPEVIEKCYSLGFVGKSLICIQGPFSHEMNLAMLKKTKAKYLVTKDTGDAGGFDAKISAAREAGVSVILITRPTEEIGYTIDEIKKILINNLKIKKQDKDVALKFPLFVDLKGKKVVVIGGGNIAKRRVSVLLDFGAEITVIAPQSQITGKINYICRKFQNEDIKDAFLVVTATNSREINHKVAEECKKMNIPVSVADCASECTFFFPAVCKSSKLTVGIVSDGTEHHLTSDTAKKIREIIGD